MTSITKKFLMALSGFFLLVFLTQHVSINFISVLSKDWFNAVSHFMGTNPFVQFLLQPVLIGGFIFHIIMGIVLEIKNTSARPVSYRSGNKTKEATWMSKNMVITGIMIMLFLILHGYDFWLPELKIKFIDGVWDDTTRYYPELQHKFHSLWRVIIYILAFIFLGLHLAHGFQSAFQSTGINHPKYTPILKKVGYIYAIIVPVVFAFVALFHFLSK